MKKPFLLSILISMFILGGCSGNPDNTKQALENATPADSVLYYLSMMRGLSMRDKLLNDSSDYATVSADYLRGVQEGMRIAKSSDQIYTRGVLTGVQMALEINKFQEKYDTVMDQRYFMLGLKEVITTDTPPQREEVREKFYGLMNRFDGRIDGNKRRKAGARHFTKPDSIQQQ